jgi:hypothetical protein
MTGVLEAIRAAGPRANERSAVADAFLGRNDLGVGADGLQGDAQLQVVAAG